MPNRTPYAALLSVALALPVTAAETYRIDSRHTFPVFETSHYGFALQRGRFNRTAGTVVLDREARTGKIDIEIDAHSIDMGLEEWDEEMKGEGFFDVKRHPTIRFRSERLLFEGDRPVAAEGILTLRGVSRPVKLEIASFSCGKNAFSGKPMCGANVSAQILRSEFGMTRLLPGVGDRVRIVIGVEAVQE